MNNPTQRKVNLPTVALMLFIVFGIPFLPLLITRRWDWIEAWIYAALNVLGFIVSRALAAKRNPDILVERANSLQHEDVKPWDRILSPLMGIGSGVIPLVAGLDVLLGGSPAFDSRTKIFALAVLLAGYIFASAAFIENRFFSGVVRIQKERGHQVVSSGPYRWVRHPGYAGALWAYLATPVLLDSRWAFIPAALLLVVTVVRVVFEDRTLQEELEGYAEYARRVKYRLFPGIW